jgi:hypothetical protein
MGDAFRGTAISPANKRTNHMIVLASIGIMFTLAVGGFVMAANSLGDQNQSPIEDTNMVLSDKFDLAEIAQPQSLREIDLVIESESGCWGGLDTEVGTIDIVHYNIPEVLPLCIDSAYLQEWYVDVLVFGGYNPWEAGGYIDVWQKDEYKGTINIIWTWMGKGDCCAYDYWKATFYVDEKICLESNQYPDVAPWNINYPDGQRTIPGKCVNFYIMTYWTGCEPGIEPSQDFTIIYSQSFYLSQSGSSSLCKLTYSPFNLTLHNQFAMHNQSRAIS